MDDIGSVVTEWTMNSKRGETHSNKVDQSIIDVGSFRQKETASRAQVMEEKQVLLLERQKRGESSCVKH